MERLYSLLCEMLSTLPEFDIPFEGLMVQEVMIDGQWVKSEEAVQSVV